MTLILSGTDGLSDVDGSAATPAIRGTDANTGIFFPAADTIAFSEGGVEAMRIDSSGNVGIGTSSPGNKLHVNGDLRTQGNFFLANTTGQRIYPYYASATNHNYIGAESDGSMSFGTGTSSPAERARIDSSGNLLVGGTTANARIYSQGLTFFGYGVGSQTSGAGAALYGGWSGATLVYTVYGDGNVVNTNNSYGAISDAKLKENIVDATPKLEKLNQVRVVNYNIIGSEQKQLGVIAQELEQIFPGMIEESPDRDAEGNDLGTTTKSVKYSVFVPMLIKAMQEQQAIIQSLTARIEALEGK